MNLLKNLPSRAEASLSQLTTVHGIKYLAARRSRRKLIICRLFYLCNFIFTAYLVYSVAERYDKKQILTQITNLEIEKIPFPTVMICNENDVSIKEMKHIAKILTDAGINKTTGDNFFSRLQLLNRQPLNVEVTDFQDYDHIFDILEKHYYSIEDIMLEVRQSCKSLLLYCSFNRQEFDCNKIFSMIKTHVGYCCAYNYAALDEKLKMDLKPESNDQVEDDFIGATGIVTTSESGRYSGLNVVFDVEAHDYPAFSAARFYGAEILISDPHDYPEMSLNRQFVSHGQNLAMKVSPYAYGCKQELKVLKPNARNCWFEDEIILKITSRYSFESCFTQCRMDAYKKWCGCIPYYYPFKNENGCRLADIPCVYNVSITQENICIYDFHSKCLPECSDKMYRVNSDLSPIADFPLPRHLRENAAKLSTLMIYFDEPTCKLYTRMLFMNWDDLIANYGGVLSLSIGVSVITLIEIAFLFLSQIMRILYSKFNVQLYQLNLNRTKPQVPN